MGSFFTNWNFFRVFRLIAGLAVLGYGYTRADWLLAGLGAMFSFMALANTSCGPFSNSCEADYKEKKDEVD